MITWLTLLKPAISCVSMTAPVYQIITFYGGAIAGSFFYTLALRIASGRFFMEPGKALFSRSACGNCGKILSPFQLIPLLGYALQRGKCRKCGADISVAYPAAEILFGALALAAAALPERPIQSFSIFLVMSAGITISIVDIKTLRIPLRLAAGILLVAVEPAAVSAGTGDAMAGFLLLFVFFAVILLLFPGAFGGGDLWFASILGFVFGLELSVVLLETALLSGAVFGVGYALITKRGFKAKIPFAPFLTAGMIVTYLAGRKILMLYYGIFF